jgi:hypothetical protein
MENLIKENVAIYKVEKGRRNHFDRARDRKKTETESENRTFAHSVTEKKRQNETSLKYA